MTGAGQVLDVLAAFAEGEITAWVDGGWGVDALLGEQTRVHDDLDLVVVVDALARAKELLEARDLVVERDWLPTALAMRHRDGRGVDLHPVERCEDGGGDQLLTGGERFHYRAPVAGRIGGRSVLCCSPQCQLAAHLGYQPEANDRADMTRLAERFGLDLPPPYVTPEPS